ncbi:MAG: hypothetical protein ACI9CD_001304 [Candidatus Deianiraeaceae bacterium]|jgi:hypothetical protein
MFKTLGLETEFENLMEFERASIKQDEIDEEYERETDIDNVLEMKQKNGCNVCKNTV